MYSRISALILRWARLTPSPEPPSGAPGSARVFRAGKNHYYIHLLRWGATQVGAVIGISFSIGFATGAEREFERARVFLSAPKPAPTPTPSPTPSPTPTPSITPDQANPPAPSPTATPRRNRNRSGAEVIARMASRMPPWLVSGFGNWFIPVLVFFEALGVITFLAQLPLTYGLVRIEFEQHWYIVTDRSLRIRTGVLSVSESTMSFANLQQVEVKQGPIQRLLGLADVRVRSAGGGHGENEPGGDALHTGSFHNVEHATEIRDLIVERLRTFREEGLGDPDSAPESKPAQEGEGRGLALIAARELLLEARSLREAVASPTA